MLLLLSWANYKKRTEGKAEERKCFEKENEWGGGRSGFYFSEGMGGGVVFKEGKYIYIYI